MSSGGGGAPALTTADAVKQEARRAMVVAADKAKLASLAISRPDTMVSPSF